MSPFATYLRLFRQRNGMHQAEFAELFGHEQGYISALELGTKGPPPQAFFDKLVEIFNFSESQKEELNEIQRISQRHFSLSPDAPAEVYRMCNDLWADIETMHPAQIRIIQEIINLPAALSERHISEPPRLRRRMKKPEQEEA